MSKNKSKSEPKRVSHMGYKLTPLVLHYFRLNEISYSDFPYFGDDWTEFHKKANASGLLLVDTADKYPMKPVVLTAEGHTVADQANRDDLFYENVRNTANENTRRTMLTFLVMYGKVSSGYYSGPSKLGEKLESLHVLTCGIDDATKTPHDETWSSFSGTFVEADRHHGLKSEITCQCGLVSEVTFQLQVEQNSYISDGNGLASMFVKMVELEKSLSKD